MAMPTAAHPSRSAAQTIAEQLLDALGGLYDYPRLQTHPLGELLVADQPRGTAAAGRALHRRMVDAVAALGAEPRGPHARAGELLRLRYVEALDVVEVCRR